MRQHAKIRIFLTKLVKMAANIYNFKLLASCALLLPGFADVTAQGPALDWVKQLEGNGNYCAPHALTNDLMGNTYVTGGFGGTVDFDPGPGTNAYTASGHADVFVMKLNATGNVIWARQMGGSPESDRGRAIAVDDSGNVYTAGIFYETADFDPGSGNAFLYAASPGWSDIFISKLNAAGEYVWAKSIGGADADDVTSIKVDTAGNVYVYGSFSSTVDFDPGSGVYPLTSTSPGGFLLKLDASGNFGWVKQFSGPGILLPTSMAYAPSGNFYLLSSMMGGSVDFDPGTGDHSLSPAGLLDFCVQKLDSGGNLVWVKHITGTSPFSMGMGVSLAIDSAEQVFTAGILMLDALDFDPGPLVYPLSPSGLSDIFISKFDTAGNFVWAKASGGTPGSASEIYGLATDTRGNVYAAGMFKNTIDYAPGTAGATVSTANPETNEPVLLKFSSTGNFSWVSTFSSRGHGAASALGVDRHGSVFSTGYFTDSCDFDPGSGVTTLFADGALADIYIHKMICADTNASVLTETAPCEGYLFGDVRYTESGTYSRVTTNAAGCDSTITLHLTILPLEAHITVNGFILGTTASYETYQWLLEGAPIANATDSLYTVTQNGRYQVVVTNDKGCSDTSDIYEVRNYTSIADSPYRLKQFRVYPNPAQDIVSVQAPVPLSLTLTDLSGRVVTHTQRDNSLRIHGCPAGVYLLQISDENGHLLQVEKLLITNP